MDSVNDTDKDALQKAISDITNTTGQVDKVQQDDVVPTVTMGQPVATNVDDAESSDLERPTPVVGGLDFAAIKTNALAELKPILETVDLAPEAKFKIYKEIIATTSDKSVVEAAYGVAKNIADDKTKAEALLFIIETIDGVN